jgi:hypothetical protein
MDIFKFIDALSKLENIAERDPALYRELKESLVKEWNKQTGKKEEQIDQNESMRSIGIELKFNKSSYN